MGTTAAALGWIGIVRLGLVQTALGSIVVLTTSTLNRVMVVELALPALLPGALVGLHYAVQIVRPRFGFGSDIDGRRTPWIVGGIAVLAAGGILAAIATALMSLWPFAGMALAAFAFALVGFGVGAAGTSLLALLAKRVDPNRRAAAATIVWMMMIAGFALTAGTAGAFLDPYSAERLVAVTACVSVGGLLLASVAVWRVEGSTQALTSLPDAATPRPAFREALVQVWAEPSARQFTIFVFVSMLAYSAQDLILEPFAGSVFGYTPGASTQLSGLQHSGVFVGMLLVAIAASGKRRFGSLRAWNVGGCLASGAGLVALAFGGVAGSDWPLGPNVFLLGVANGAFAVAAIGSMMNLAGEGRASREGTRMGLWGAAQAIAFGIGGFAGTVAADIARFFIADTGLAYGLVFAGEGLLFVAAAVMAAGVGTHVRRDPAPAVASGSPV